MTRPGDKEAGTAIAGSQQVELDHTDDSVRLYLRTNIAERRRPAHFGLLRSSRKPHATLPGLVY
jgi:hypothetical protein